MTLLKALNKYFFDMSLNELKLMNENKLYPNISYNSLLYLDLISHKENCTSSQIAKILHISKSAVTMKVNELIEQGFVEKRQSDKDKRIYYLSVVPEVLEDYKRYDESLERAVKTVEEAYSEKDVEKFIEMLEIVKNTYMDGFKNE